METNPALLAICAGNSPVPGEFPAQRPVTRSLMFSLICDWINGWVNNSEAGELRRHHAIMTSSDAARYAGEKREDVNDKFHMNIMLAISGDLTNKNNNKNIERHTAYTIVPWPNPKLWMMVGVLLVIMFYTHRSISHEHEYGFSTVRPRQNYRHFDSVSRLIFLYEKCFTLIKIVNRHDDVIKWKHFLLYWRLVIFSLIWALKRLSKQMRRRWF